MKFVFLIAFIGILGALAAAGFFMLRHGRGNDKRGSNMARALAVRVAVSVALFAFILFCWWMGWIEPKGVPLNR
jgi:Co/Zn/Cd efflux system component